MDPLLVQKQVRDNVDELNSFLNDLKNWEKDMKRKDQELSNSASDTVAVPPVRNKIKRSKTTDYNDKSSGIKEVKRISSYDYSAWDKFDVEEACAVIDNKEKEPERLDSESGMESADEVARLREQAMYEKELGNQHVKERRWKEAIDCYTKAIQCNPCDAIFYANRALCFLKTKQPKLAETDCTTALQLDNTYVKAYQRRALARIEIGLRDDAKADFHKVLEFEPNNSAAKSELSKLENWRPTTSYKNEKDTKKIQKSKSLEQKISKEKPCTKGTPEEGKKIEENKSLKQNISKEKLCTTKTSEEAVVCQRRLEIAHDMLGAGGDTGTLEAPCSTFQEGDKDVLPVQKPPHLRSKRPLRVIPVQEVETMTDLLEQNFKTEKIIDNTSERKIVEIKTSAISELDRATEQIVLSDRSEPVVKTLHVKEKREEPLKLSEYETSNCKAIDVPPVPKTSVQFLVSWKIIRNNSDLRYQFLKQIPGLEFPQIFQESLESREFSEIITTLAAEFLERNESVYPYLQGLSQVKRFSALVMFMSKTEKAFIKKLIQHCDENNECSKEDILELLKRYEIK